jgi:hypothetical protein
MFTADDLPPGSSERVEVAGYSAGAACNPDDVVLDWGEYDEDTTADDAAKSFEYTDTESPHADFSFPAAENLESLYNQS